MSVTLERPSDLAAASRRLAALQGKGAILGGGLELFEPSPDIHPGKPDILIPMRNLGATSYIHVRGEEVRIGASTTVAEIAESDFVKRFSWPLAEAAAAIGSPQIRAQATIAGNLLQRPRCWYFRNGFPCRKNGAGQGCPAESGDNRHHAIFDGGPTHSVFHSDLGLVLHALNATLVVVTPTGEKTMPVSELYMDPKTDVTREHVLKPGEIIREIRMPQLDARHVGTFMKIRERSGFDFAIVSVAMVYTNYYGQFRNMHIYLGGVAPRPYIPQGTIASLQKNKLSRQLIPRAAARAAEGAVPMAHNAYKIHIVNNLVQQALEKTYDRLSWKPD